MTRAEFLPIFNRLAVALREPQDESGVTQGVYFDALGDLDVVSLTAAAVALSREQGRRFFPSTGEWFAAALAAAGEARRKVLALPAGRTTPWQFECESCEDTGWVQGLTCEGSATCGRSKVHAAHSFTRPCACRATNRTYARHHAP